MLETKTEVGTLNFKYIKGTNLVEVWYRDRLLKVVEIDESEFLLTNLMQVIEQKAADSNVIERQDKSFWQKESRKSL